MKQPSNELMRRESAGSVLVRLEETMVAYAAAKSNHETKRDRAREAKDIAFAVVNRLERIAVAVGVLREVLTDLEDTEASKLGDVGGDFNEALDAILEIAEHQVCRGCGAEIDPTTCGCGDPMEGHGNPMNTGHSAVPDGCNCYRVRSAPPEEPPEPAL